jgi:hypothetical protein
VGKKEESTSYFVVERESRPIGFDPSTTRDGEVTSISKAFLDDIPGASRQDHMLGRKEHPFSFRSSVRFKHYNVHHSACIEAKVASTVGLGFFRAPVMEAVEQTTPEEQAAQDQANVDADRELKAKEIDVKAKSLVKPKGPIKKAVVEQPKVNVLTGETETEDRSKVATTLDPLCAQSFQDVITDVAEDFWQTGNGYIEVVRDADGTPIALYHAPAKDVYVVVEDDLGRTHYEVTASDGSSFTRKFAKYGDRDGLIKRGSGGRLLGGTVSVPTKTDLLPTVGRPKKGPRQNRLNELVHFRRPTSFSKFYGFPDWLACVLAMELKQCSTQHLYDLFLNRGVPELLICLSGGTVPKDEWEAFKRNLRSHQGMKNSHKTMAFNVGQPNVKLEVHKLAMEGQGEELYLQLADVLASEVVSAHGVPPLLAGIQIPGKLGANNELPNSLLAFQLLRCGPAQEVFETTLINTLGRDFPELGPKEWKLRSILEKFDLQKAATMSSMREPMAQAQARGRDMKAGPILD